jgi:hypothetical protein
VEPGPFSLALGGIRWLALNASAVVDVDHSARKLNLGELVVDYSAARCWQPLPDWQALRRMRPEPGAAHGLPTGIALSLDSLLGAICARDIPEARAAARRLAGRGIGLTPTGDDVLTGVLYGLWVWGPDRELLQAIAESAAPYTTTLSGAFLRAAAAGEASYPWHRLARGDGNAAGAIVATGHSSGREAWTAYVTTWTRLAGERR